MWCNIGSPGPSIPAAFVFLIMEGLNMSRIATPPMAHPAAPPVRLPHEKIAARAYEKWCKRGCPHGTDEQDWAEAEVELRAEYTRIAPTPTRR